MPSTPAINTLGQPDCGGVDAKGDDVAPKTGARNTTVWTALAGVPFSIRYIDIAGWSTRVLVAGDADNDAVVLLAGTGGHLEAYARNIVAFAQRYRVIAYDYPGHGYSTPATVDLEIPTYMEHLRALLRTFEIPSAHLCGESLGGWVAAKFAAAYPQLVKKLVLNTPGGSMMDPEVMVRIRSLSQAAAENPTPETIRTRLEWLMADPASVTDELVAIRRGIYSRPGFATSMRHILCLQDVETRRRNLITDDELTAIASPTLVIWTSDDPSGPAAAGREMTQKLKDGQFVLIEGAGHWPQWEQTEAFNEIVLEYLAQE